MQPSARRLASLVITSCALHSGSISNVLAAPDRVVHLEALLPGFTMAPGDVASLEASAVTSNPPIRIAAAYPDMPGWPVSVLGGLSSPVVADVDPSYPGLEVAVGSLSSAGNVWLFHADGTLVSGWPVDIGFFVAASPAIADLDGDGALEIVASDFAGNDVWALRRDGTPMPGWPIAVGANVRSTPAIADLDPIYPGLEIVVGVQDGTVQAWHYDGTAVPGWPVMAGNFVERCSPAIGDVDLDGDLEVFVGSWDIGGPASGGFYAFDHHGVPLDGWPVLRTGTISVIASPALADLDGDGDLEIIDGTYETNARMFVWHHDGTVMTGWPRTIPRAPASGSHMSSSPAIGDLDGDGMLEIVIGSIGQCGIVYAWHRDGTTVSAWPVLTNAVVDGSNPVLGDVDGGGDVEVVVGSGSGFTPFGCTAGAISRLYVFKADGTPSTGWPLDLGTASEPQPAIWDLDGDGDVELVLAWSGSVFAWDAPGAAASPGLQWPFMHFDIAHIGRYRTTPFTSVPEAPGSAAAGASSSAALLVRPNPQGAAGEVRLRFALPAGSPVDVSIFDTEGRTVRAIHATHLEAGEREIAWDGNDERGRRVRPGVYFAKIGHAGGTQVAKVIVAE